MTRATNVMPLPEVTRRPPWWLSVLLGIACVVLGIVLTVNPVTSLSILAILLAISFLATGISELASAGSAPVPWLVAATGPAWIGVAAALVWAGLTIHALVILAGISLGVGGVVKVASGMRGNTDLRTIAVLSGLASIVFGALGGIPREGMRRSGRVSSRRPTPQT